MRNPYLKCNLPWVISVFAICIEDEAVLQIKANIVHSENCMWEFISVALLAPRR